jgi:hypothetical protein
MKLIDCSKIAVCKCQPVGAHDLASLVVLCASCVLLYMSQLSRDVNMLSMRERSLFGVIMPKTDI